MPGRNSHSISLPPDWRKKTVWIQHHSFKFYFVLQVAFRRPIKLPDVAVRPFGYREGNRLSCRSIALGSDEPQRDTVGDYWRMQVQERVVRAKVPGAGLLITRQYWRKRSAKPRKSLGRLADQ